MERSIARRFQYLGALFGLGFCLQACSSFLYYPSQNLIYDPARLNLKPEEVFFSGPDGKKLFGWYFRNVKGAKPKATVIFFHGNGENLSSHYLSLVWLLDHPYDFFIFDYQGYGRSEGDPTPANTVEAGTAALDWVHQRLPETPLVVFGQSLGGAVALRTTIENKDRLPIKFVAVDSTFASYRSVGRQALARSWITWPLQWLGWLLLSDTHAPDGRIEEISPVPLLVIHGNQDQVVDYSQGERVFAQAKEPKEFWRISGGGHTDIFSLQGPEYKKKFLLALENALEGKP